MSKKHKAQQKEMTIAADGAIINPLTPAEARQLKSKESVIQKHKQGFLKAAAALLEIRDLRLWRDKYQSFDEYCQKKWKFGDRWARKLFTAAEITHQITAPEPGSGDETAGTIESNAPSSAKQVLPLAQIEDPKERKKIWDKANERAKTKGGNNKRPTAKDVKNEIARNQHQRLIVNAQNPLMSAYTSRSAPPPQEAEIVNGEAAFNPVLPDGKSLGEIAFDAWESSMTKTTKLKPDKFQNISAAGQAAWEEAAKAAIAEHENRIAVREMAEQQ